MFKKETKKILNENTDELKTEADRIENGIIHSRQSRRFFNKYGPNAGSVIRATAVNKAKKNLQKQKEQALQTSQPEEQTPETMDENKLRQLVRDALSKPLEEKKKSADFTSKYDDQFTDKRKNLPDKLQKAILGKMDENHEDQPENDRYMFFSNLQQMRRQCGLLLDLDHAMIERILDNGHDWAQDHIAEAKSFLDQVFDFFMNETKKHNMELSMDVRTIDEKLKPSMGAGKYVKDFEKSKAPQFKGKSEKKRKQMAVAAYLSAEDKNKIKEAVLAKLKNK